MQENLPKWILFIRTYFSLWGFGSILFKRKIGSLIFIGHIVLCTQCAFWAFDAFFEGLAVLELLDSINFFLFYITSILSYCCIIYDSFVSQTLECAFWNCLLKINSKFCSQIKMKTFWYFNALTILLAADILILIYAIWRERKSKATGKVMHFIFLMLTDQRIFYYILHLKVIAFQLLNIDMELNKQHSSKFAKKFWEKSFQVDSWLRKIGARNGRTHQLNIWMVQLDVTFLDFSVLRSNFGFYLSSIQR